MDRQRITEFYLNGVDVRTLPRNPEAERELNELPRFALEGEHWIVWNVSSAQLPPSSGFDTSFALSPAYPDGQTVMWAVAYAGESYADDHVYVGYADVTRPDKAGRRRRGR
ncbi:MAG TPA: hypothetical protein VMQ51_19340 [Candidatus Binatia bacterium]|nr:hypothetical protein [Candidatus Binatia bacterium]